MIQQAPEDHMTVSPQQNIPFISQEQPDGADFKLRLICESRGTVNMFLSWGDELKTRTDRSDMFLINCVISLSHKEANWDQAGLRCEN